MDLTSPSTQTFVPTRNYSFDALAEVYNQGRVDYIVPMPMNGKRMAEYVHDYDIDLDASMVAISADQLELGLIMLGVRDDRSWITRLGIIPERRGHKVGQRLAELMIGASRAMKIRRMQLEVIQGNEPAHRLFSKLDFVETRELMIIRRPPSKVDAALAPQAAEITDMKPSEVSEYIAKRSPDAAWTEEPRSLLHVQGLQGLFCTLPSGETGWAIYQRMPFQLTHFVINPDASEDMTAALLRTIHSRNPMHDTKIENVPRGYAGWPVFQKFGYLEVFSRIEMYLYL